MNKAQAMVCINSVQEQIGLESLIRESAQRMLAVALRAEADAYIKEAVSARDEQGHQMVVGNGLTQQRTVQTSVGTVLVRQPRVYDRRDGHQFTSAILPPYIRRTKDVDAMIALLYLHGVSTTRMQEALKGLIGDRVSAVSPAVVCTIMERWQAEYKEWSTRTITDRIAYIWVDGIYTKVRTTNDRPCILVVVGCDAFGQKQILSVVDGERESEISWTDVLTDLKMRGLQAPRVAIGDGALGFWAAVSKVYPSTVHQGCTVHALRNALDKVPKKLQEQVKELLHKVFMATTRKDAMRAFGVYKSTFIKKYPKAVETIEHRLDMLLAFYAYPSEHWKSLRSTNVIESAFATIRRRSHQTNGSGSREAAIAMMYTLAVHAQNTWRRIDGFTHVAHVLNGLTYSDGELKMAA